MKRKTVTAEEARAMLTEEPKRNKMNVRIDAEGSAARTMDVDGKPVVFDSVGEMQRWAELKLLEKAGKISDLRRQMPVTLQSKASIYRNGKPHMQRPIKCRVDFEYYETTTNTWYYEDFKGDDMEVSRLKRKLLINQLPAGGGAVVRVTYADGTREDYTR